MEEKKNIDQLFQERFKEFEAPAPADAWNHIAAKLDKKEKPTIFPLWWKIAGVAAAFAIVFSAVLWNYEESIKTEGVVIENPASGIPSEQPPATTDKDAIVIKENTGSRSNMDQISSSSSNQNDSSNARATGSDGSNNNESLKTPATDKDFLSASNQPNNAIVDQTIENSNTNRSADPNTSSVDPKARDAIAGNQPSAGQDKNGNNTLTVEDAITSDEKGEKFDVTEHSGPTLEQIAAAEIKELEDKKTLEQDLFTKKWSAATVVAPIYTNSLGGSSINNQVSDNNKSTDVNLSYGVAVAYEFAQGWSLRTGVSQVRMNYNTEDISYRINAQTLTVRGAAPGIMFDPQAVNTQNTSALDDSFAQELVSAATFSSFQGELSQQLGYIEVPLEVKYRLMDRKFGISILGGMSALFLTDNEVSVTNDSRKLELGADGNFQDFNQSANFGLGIEYRFTEKLGLSVEPTFKYQLNALRNDTADFRPYTMGVYTGLMYRF